MRKLVLNIDIDLVLSLLIGLQRYDALTHGIGLAVDKRVLLVRAVGALQEGFGLLRELRLVRHPVSNQIGSRILSFVNEDTSSLRYADFKHVTLIDISIVLLFLSVYPRRQHACHTGVDVHRSGNQEEYQQQESNIRHRTGVDLVDFSFLLFHCSHYDLNRLDAHEYTDARAAPAIATYVTRTLVSDIRYCHALKDSFLPATS